MMEVNRSKQRYQGTWAIHSVQSEQPRLTKVPSSRNSWWLFGRPGIFKKVLIGMTHIGKSIGGASAVAPECGELRHVQYIALVGLRDFRGQTLSAPN